MSETRVDRQRPEVEGARPHGPLPARTHLTTGVPEADVMSGRADEVADETTQEGTQGTRGDPGRRIGPLYGE